MTGSEPKRTDPLTDLAATPVEKTASERDPDAIPPVAGAADPQVLAEGLTPSPVVAPVEGEDAVRRESERKQA